MNKLQTLRWLAAKAMFTNLIKMAKAHNASIMMDQMPIELKNIHISDQGIYVVLDNCTFTWFECDPAYDHGVYTPKQEFAKQVRQSFKLAKLINF